MLSAVPSLEHKVTSIRDTSAQDRPIDSAPLQSRRRYLIIGGAIAGALLLLVLIMMIRNWSAAEVSVPRDRVRIATVTRGQFVRDVSAQGTVVAAVSPTLYAPATGTVHFIVQAGDAVTRGQVIAQLDSPELRNELAREESSLASLEVAVQRQSIDTRRQLLTNQQAIDLANVNIQAADREQRRAEDSWAKRVISEREYEKARDEAAAAAVNHKHAIETASLQKESLQFELSARKLDRDRQQLMVQDLTRRVRDLDMNSPVDGIVGSLLVGERATVAQNAVVISVVDLSGFETEFTVPESYADDLALGMAAQINYAGRKYPAKVSAVSPEVKQGQVTGRLRFAGEIPQGLRQNQRVATRIVIESRDNVLKVPRGAFLDSGGGRVAFLVQGDIATRTAIETGGTSITEVELIKGVSEGDQLVISNVGEFERVKTVRLAD